MVTTFSLRSVRYHAMALVAGFCLATGLSVAQDDLGGGNASPFERGMQALESEDYETAQQAFSEAIATNPANARAYTGRARALAGLDQQQTALEDFQDAIDLTQRSDQQSVQARAEAQFYRGMMYLDLSDQFAGTALTDLRTAYDADRSNLDYAYGLGKAYALLAPSNRGLGQQAEPLLTQYLEANPDDAEALRLRGTAYASMNKMDEAFADLNRAVELDPNNHRNYLTLATIHITQEDYPKSAEALRSAIDSYEPEEGAEDMPFAQGYLTLASVYEQIGKDTEEQDAKAAAFTSAIETCQELLDLLPDGQAADPARANAYYQKGVAHRLLGEFGKGVRALTQAIEINPELGMAYFRRAICYTEMGENRLALRDLQDAQALNFEDARPYLWQGITNARMGEYRDAIRAYNTAISFSNRYVDAYLNRAHAYFQLGEYENAIDSFNECIRLQSEVPSYYFKRGLCYENLEQYDQAIQSYTTALEFGESFAPAYDRLISLLERSGQSDLAAEYRARRSEVRKEL